MSPAALLERARGLLEPGSGPRLSLWSRAAAVLVRHALESHLATVLAKMAPGSQAAPFRAQLLCLGELAADKDLARRVAYTWAALSTAVHHNGYELAPASVELRRWLDTVEEFVRAT